MNTLHMELFAGFIEKLKATPDGDGTLLDHSMIVYGSGLSDGNRHTHEDLPVLIVGARRRTSSVGTHIVYPKDTPMTNLFLTLLDRMGVREDKIGDSTGPHRAPDRSVAHSGTPPRKHNAPPGHPPGGAFVIWRSCVTRDVALQNADPDREAPNRAWPRRRAVGRERGEPHPRQDGQRDARFSAALQRDEE